MSFYPCQSSMTDSYYQGTILTPAAQKAGQEDDAHINRYLKGQPAQNVVTFYTTPREHLPKDSDPNLIRDAVALIRQTVYRYAEFEEGHITCPTSSQEETKFKSGALFQEGEVDFNLSDVWFNLASCAYGSNFEDNGCALAATFALAYIRGLPSWQKAFNQTNIYRMQTLKI